MSSDVVICAEGLGKRYRLGTIKKAYGTLRESMTELVARALKGKDSDRQRPAPQTIWALKDVSFEVKQGEVLGVIGRNGAGKTTLLKILSKITAPTEGRISFKGRVGSLLEVGTGFHPELTGRENVFLNGAILGMTRSEIKRKFDQIVDFSGVEKFLDTPVKRYSSGMYVRLAFAVAAHMEPEILVVDEVLAVGDMEFQKKCLGKMDSISRQEGRTVLFVSHNMGAVNQLCTRALLLDQGTVKMEGRTQEVTRTFMQSCISKEALNKVFKGTLADSIEVTAIRVNDHPIGSLSVLEPKESIVITVSARARKELTYFILNVSLFRDGVRLLTIEDSDRPESVPEGPFESKVEIPAYFLRPGEYSIAIGGYRISTSDWLWGTDIDTFVVNEDWSVQYSQYSLGMVNLQHKGARRILTETKPQPESRGNQC